MNISKFSYRTLLLLIFINLGVLVYLMHTNYYWTSKPADKNYSQKLHEILTVVLYDFEHFENEVTSTVNSILALSPKINIVIVSDDLPYPPLQLSRSQVKIKTLKIKPDQSSKQARPEEFITTKYTLFVPDGFLLKKTQSLVKMIEKMADDRIRLVAAGAVDKFQKNAQCEKLKFDLRQWTLSYSSPKIIVQNGLQICDAVKGDVAILTETIDLQELSSVFIRPHIQAFFIQTVLRNWKTGLITWPSPFEKHTQMFTSGHNRWKHETNRKHHKAELFKRFGIKKVKMDDGSEEWFGCKKNTPRCFGTIINDVPSFIYDGRWTPPCCLQNLRTTARHVFKILDKNGIPYWLEGGSLLGAARNADIIPWDYDVDIGMYKKDIERLPQLRQARDGENVSDEEGFVWEKSREGDFFRVQFSAINHLHVDIFPFYEKNGIMTKDTWFKTHRQDTEFPEHYLKPLKRIKFIGMDVSVPNNHKKFLEFKFGKGVIESPKYPNAQNVNKSAIQFRIPSFIPYDSSLLSSLACGTLSNALAKSKKCEEKKFGIGLDGNVSSVRDKSIGIPYIKRLKIMYNKI